MFSNVESFVFGKKGMRRRRFAAIPLLIIVVFFGIYVSDYYRAEPYAVQALQSDKDVLVTQEDYGWFFDGPSEESALIFYPGGKVEETAYAPLLHRLASVGLDVCLVKMPFRLAVFDRGAAAKVMRQHRYARWYIGGHSLGGAMAAIYASGQEGVFSGIVLLAAYPTKPLPADMEEILLVGSEDRVVKWERIAEGRKYAPENYTEHIIEGGNHAQFGSYGLQKGDGAAKISADDQLEESVRIIRCLAP